MNTDLPRDLQRKRALKRLGSFVLLASMIAFVMAPIVIALIAKGEVNPQDLYVSIAIASILFIGLFFAVRDRRIIRKRLYPRTQPEAHRKTPAEE